MNVKCKKPKHIESHKRLHSGRLQPRSCIRIKQALFPIQEPVGAGREPRDRRSEVVQPEPRTFQPPQPQVPVSTSQPKQDVLNELEGNGQSLPEVLRSGFVEHLNRTYEAH